MSDDNKEMIANTALKLFAQKGYEGVGVQEICDAAGITKPTLYHYFKSKRGLLENLVEDFGRRLILEIKKGLNYEHDFIKSLTMVLQSEIDFARSNKDFFDFHCILLHSPVGSEQQQVYESFINEIMNIFNNFFELSCNELGNMKGKERLYSQLFHNEVVSVSAMCACDELTADDETIYRIIHSYVYGVAN